MTLRLALENQGLSSIYAVLSLVKMVMQIEVINIRVQDLKAALQKKEEVSKATFA